MLLNLSVELLEAIGAQLTRSDLAIMRAVCKDLNGALWRLFFSVLVLETKRNGFGEDGIEMLKALASGQTGWTLHARALRVIQAPPVRDECAHNEEMVDLLAAALKSLSDIRTVVWHVRDDNFWTSAQTTIIDFLNTSVTVHELELCILGTVDLSTLQVRRLRKFTLRSPGVGWDWEPWNAADSTPMYRDVAQLVSQNQLKSLHLDCSAAWSVIWGMMRSSSHGLKLAEITTGVVTQELFDYLTSYSGVERLTLKLPDGGNEKESNRLADTFFETVLSRHAESLTELCCPAAYESRFSFGAHNVNVVSQLHKLTRLEMSINAGAVREVQEPESYLDSDGTVHPIFPIGINVEADQADIDPVVALLLETAAMFPHLQSLTILSAETESNRGVWCGNGRISHMGAVDAAIGNAVEAFRTNVLCSAIIRAGYNTYELRPLCGPQEAEFERGLWYKRTGNLEEAMGIDLTERLRDPGQHGIINCSWGEDLLKDKSKAVVQQPTASRLDDSTKKSVSGGIGDVAISTS
ncbi:hypothetical protein MSAN_01581400 [Mycena sanguinolenta]|uniref:F-box domain-containing protein n=1 Tax=Mycena sanguinolenta TaxID=230812 RepID=A0A8H7CXE8_9AGAR|nr:hypothetical protein MSAN_01581400 [Mycena sanguinolenta]